MAINFDNALGPLPAALSLRAERTALIANNIANADTPNFKARDLPFDRLLAEALQKPSTGQPVATDPRHITKGAAGSAETDLLFRRPLLPSIDGNTVDVHLEQSAFAENNVQFEASLQFLSSRFKNLVFAIRGE